MLPSAAASAVAHVLLLMAGLCGIYLVRSMSRTQELWSRLAVQISSRLEAGLVDVLSSNGSLSEQRRLHGLSDAELRRRFLLPTLRRLNKAYAEASSELEHQKAWRFTLTGLVALVATTILRSLCGKTFWSAVGWAAVALALFLVLDVWVIVPVVAWPDGPTESVPYLVQQGCSETAELRGAPPG